MAEDIASLGLEFDTSGLTRGRSEVTKTKKELDQLADSADKTGKKGKEAFKEFGDGVGYLRNLLGAAAIGATIRAVLQETAEAEKQFKLLERTLENVGGQLGVTAAEMKAYSLEMQNLTTFSDEAYIATQRTFVQLQAVTKDTLPRATQAAADLASAWGTDVVDSATALARALKDPEEGLMMLNRQTRLFDGDQKKALKAMVESGQAAEAQEIILSKLEEQYKGTAVAARDTLGGAFTSLKQTTGNLLEGEGAGLEDLKASVESLNALLQDPAVIQGMQSFATVVLGMVEGFATLVAMIVNTTKAVGELVGAIAAGGSDGYQSSGEVQGQIDRIEALIKGKQDALDSGRYADTPRAVKALNDEVAALKLKNEELEKIRRNLYEMEMAKAGATRRDDGTLVVEGGKGGKDSLTEAKERAKAAYEKALATAKANEVEKEAQKLQDDTTRQLREYNAGLVESAEAERQRRYELDPALKLQAEYNAAIHDAQELFGDGKNPEAFGNAVADAAAKLETGMANLEGIGDIDLTKPVDDLTASFGDLEDAIYNVTTAHGKSFGLMIRGLTNIAKDQEKFTKNSMRGYGQMTAGLQGFFREGSKGYKTMGAISTAFHALELANTLATTGPAAVKALVTSLQAPPPANFASFAAVSAIIAGLGVAVSGGSGGGGKPKPSINDGEGTVLGDKYAKSESIGKSLEQIAELAESGLGVSYAQLFQLRSIDAAIRGVATSLIQMSAARGSLTPFGNKIGMGLFDATVKHAGVAFDPTQSLGSIMGGGDVEAQYWASVFKSGKNKQYTDLEQGVIDDFTSIIREMGQAVIDAVGALGIDANAAREILEGLSLGIGAIDLKGLSGEEIQEKLSAVFSALGDTMVTALVPELAQFQRVGEGLLETLIRVSSETSAFTGLLDDMGVGLGDVGHLMKIEITQSLAELAGGFDNLIDGMQSFFDAFYSEEEKMARSQGLLTDALAQVGEELPETRAGFRGIIEGLDLQTESGKQAFVVLTSLADIADEYYDSLEDAAEAIDSLVNSLRKLSDEAGGALQGLVGIENNLADLRSEFTRQSRLAGLGNVDAAKKVLELGDKLIEQSLSGASTREEYQRDLLAVQQGATRAADVLERNPFVVLPENQPLTNQTFIQGNEAVASEVAQLRTEMREVLYEVAKSTKLSQERFRNWDDGDAIRVTTDSGNLLEVAA